MTARGATGGSSSPDSPSRRQARSTGRIARCVVLWLWNQTSPGNLYAAVRPVVAWDWVLRASSSSRAWQQTGQGMSNLASHASID
jgi:hypothetical protein